MTRRKLAAAGLAVLLARPTRPAPGRNTTLGLPEPERWRSSRRPSGREDVPAAARVEQLGRQAKGPFRRCRISAALRTRASALCWAQISRSGLVLALAGPGPCA